MMGEEKKEESFEEKLKKTKEILEKLGDSELPLNEGIKLYKEGMKELNEATKMLENAKLEFETIENGLGNESAN